MKFSCGECQAKYQIPDERVAGRKLKIRCRKCGAAISLRGDPTIEGIAGLQPAKSSVEWHVSIEGDQHGPYATDQMAGMLRGSQLDWEAYVWREGYGDWKTADSSDTLVRAVASIGSDAATPTAGIAPYEDDDGPTRMKPAPDQDEQPTRMAVNAPLIAQPLSFDHEPTSQQLPAQSPQSQALQPQARSAFAQRAASVRAYGSAPPHVYASVPPALPQSAGANVRQLPLGRSPRVSAAQAMTAERNEDSVLFSANNLVPSSQQMPAQRAGYASQEGSGLIDIRALAALAHSQRSPVAQPTASEAYIARAEEPLPAIVHQAGTFSRIDSLSPFERPPQRASSAVPIAIIAGAAMIAVAMFLAVYLTQQPATTPTAVVAAPPAETAAAAQPTDDTLPTTAEAPSAVPAAAVAPEPEADEPVAAAEPADEPARETSSRKAGKVRSAAVARGSSRAPKPAPEPKAVKAERGSAAAKVAAAEPEPAAEKEKPSIDDLLLDDSKPAAAAAAPAAAEPAKPKAAAGPRDIDSLMNGAVPTKQAAAGAPPGDSSLPELPSRDDVKATMGAVADDVKACAEGQTLADPVATVALTVIGATGRVQSVRVTGNPGPVGTCIARAVRAAAFPKFSKVQQTINFPFKLK
jgi:predicted Zn finger-like uncharacterized protein